MMRSLRGKGEGGVSNGKRERSTVCSFHSYAICVVESIICRLRSVSKLHLSSRLDNFDSTRSVPLKGFDRRDALFDSRRVQRDAYERSGGKSQLSSLQKGIKLEKGILRNST